MDRSSGRQWPDFAQTLRALRGLARPRLMAPIATLAVLVLVSVVLSHLSQEVRYRDVVVAIRATPWRAVALAVLLAGVSFSAMVAYDLAGLAYVGRRLPLGTTALASFCAFAVGNMAGFGPLTGGAVRYRFYAPLGLEPEAIGRIVAFVAASFGISLVGVAAIGLVISAEQVAAPFGIAPALLRLAGIAILVLEGGLLLLAARRTRLAKIHRLARLLPGPAVLLRQFAATLVDTLAAGGVLWVLLPPGGMDLPGFIAVYAAALSLGVLSHVPAGLGVFETVILAACAGGGATDRVIGALLLYRVIYYVLPLMLAALAVAVSELRRALGGPAAARLLDGVGRLAPQVLGALTLLLGAMLVLSGVTPAPSSRLHLLARFVPLSLVEGSHFLASVLGLVLLVVARGLTYRLDGAWLAAILAIPAAILLTLLKGAPLGQAVVLAVLLTALLATRRQFSRPASLIHQAMTPGWCAAIGVVLIAACGVLFFTYRDVQYANELWWQFEFSGHAPRSLRALMGVALIAGFSAIWLLLRHSPAAPCRPDRQTLARAVAIAMDQPMAAANLVRVGDKNILLSADDRAFLMYARQARSWVALFDPVGAPEAWPELVWRFVEMARHAGCRAVFYQVAPENLALYADAGLRAYKLGEEARIDLAAFTLQGSRYAALRQTLRRGERDGLEFALLAPGEAAAVMDALRGVSDAWLARRQAREKRFSMGAFDPDYLAAQPVAVLRRGNRIVAFASLMVTNCNVEATVDLMRFDDDAPPGAMEFLFVRLIQQLKADRCRWFSLGMAPLSGLSENPAAPLWHRAGRALYEHASRFYNFRGLRTFKAKFHPEWQPRYLAVSGNHGPILALADTALLIGGGLKGVIGK